MDARKREKDQQGTINLIDRPSPGKAVRHGDQ
jgi:hypothetical protein